MHMPLDVIFAVILSLSEYSKNDIAPSYLFAGISNYLRICFHGYRNEGYSSMSQFSFLSGHSLYSASVIPLMTGRPFLLVTFLLATRSSFYGHSADGSDYLSFPSWCAEDALAVTFY